MENNRHKTNRARQRYEDRRKKRDMVTLADEVSTPPAPKFDNDALNDLWLKVQDFVWYVRTNTPIYPVIGVIGVIFVGLFVLNLVFSPQIGANVWALNIDLAGMTIDQAQDALKKKWDNDVQISVRLDGDVLQQIKPSQIGLTLDAGTMAQQAKEVRWQGFPFGYEIQPIVNADYSMVQTYLLTLVDTVYIPTYEAGFAWEGQSLIAVPGRESRELDLLLTLENITQNPLQIIKTRSIDLLTKSNAPAVLDSSVYLTQAQNFLSQDFRLVGYDPFIDQQMPWTSTRDEIAKWISASPTGLIARENEFKKFVDAINSQLRAEVRPRYLDQQEAISQFNQALANNSNEVLLRIRYAPTTLTIASGDWGQRISRRTGLPFGLIEDVNPGVDWNVLSIGDVINLPSRDLLLPEIPVPTKRIIVDLDRRYMVAYENGQVVMSWRVSIGRNDAPTYPGIFQVLTHNEKAFGSGFSLCGDAGCSQWEMEWFMGIYEVVPGLMNGFHGAVLLPNGAYLDDGQVGNASTFGCVMANNEQSKQLYDWAEVGTVVEIVSAEFPPESALAKQAMEYISKSLSS